MKRLIVFTLILISIIAIEGCWAVRTGIKNIPEVIFSEPENVKNKIKDPIKPGVRLSALWVGHSTVLLQMYDKVILIDPVFNDVIGGLLMRRTEAGLDIKSIPYLNMILVSHAHMDHMSLVSLQDLDDKFPKTKLVFPYGAENYLSDYNMDMIRLNTGNSDKRGFIGESIIIDDVKVTSVYALHFGGRYGLDSYLWNVPGCTAYIIEYKDLTIFYAGDTAYDDEAFKELGKKFEIDLALIPIGPCRNCYLTGQFTHVAPFGALLMFEELNAEYMIPVHYGALTYGSEADHPVRVLKVLLEGKGGGGSDENASRWSYIKERVKILEEGQQIVFDN